MQSVELKTLEYFLRISVYDLEYLGPAFTNCFNAFNTLNRQDSTFIWSLHLKKTSFDMKCGVAEL